MAIYMISEEGHVKAGIYEFVVDTEAEISELPTDKKIGSTAKCIENSKIYMLNGSGNWVEVNFKSGGGSGSGGVTIHICSSSEYSVSTRIPIISNPDASTFYLVPAADGASPNMFVEYIYVNDEWEMFGSVTIDTDIVTDVEVDGTSVVTNGIAEITMPTVPTQASDIGAVPTTTSVNGKALSNNITLVAADVGASLARIVRW